MIYPPTFPKDRLNEKAELEVYNRLSKIQDQYDIFYSKMFVTDGVNKKSEFEIDFIIIDPDRGVICLEVKGGLVNYDGNSSSWKQNGKRMKDPIQQATSNCHSFLKKYLKDINQLPVGWAVCFPACELANRKSELSSVTSSQIIDQASLVYPEYAIEDLLKEIEQAHSGKRGIRQKDYGRFKEKLLRGLGFVQTLATRIKYGEERFIELTDLQQSFFNRVLDNDYLIVDGPAGSGKTILAKTLASDFIAEGKKVLLICFNRTLANKIRYEFERNQENLNVTTFHSLARELITEFEPNWWDENKSSSDEFWALEVPAKMDELMQFVTGKYDVLIIDEGQDFKLFWFELLYKLVNDNGRRFIFLDKFQNIFGHFEGIPQEREFSRFHLNENCRNSKQIIGYLEKVIDSPIPTFEKTPFGEAVIEKSFTSDNELTRYLEHELKGLFNNEKIRTDQILILYESSKSISILTNTSSILGIPLKSLDNKARFEKDALNYTSINTFKGLEADIVIIINGMLNSKIEIEKAYTMASRARHKLYLLST